MSRELYFDISSEWSGGSLYRVKGLSGVNFYYNHSTYDDKKDEIKVFETIYPDFTAFWKELTKDQNGIISILYLFIPNNGILCVSS